MDATVISLPFREKLSEWFRSNVMEIVIILLLALVLDLTFGDPPTALHPVGWMGKVISFLIKGGKGHGSGAQFAYGLGVVLITLSLFVVPVYFGLAYLRNINVAAYIIVAAIIFKTSFTLKGLWQSALKIKSLLAMNNSPRARFELRALVGRDTSELGQNQLISATVESVAENSCDSFVAPLFYFLFLGVPGAVGYRVINTLDAMIGHHGEYEYLGKFAAKLDTAANFIPARITALAIVFSSWIWRQKADSAWRIMLRDRRNTESPNAGWTMGAMAGALQVQLEKVGYYKLGDSRKPLSLASIDTALRVVLTATALWSLAVIAAKVVYRVTT
jgi:adenosylcobinamide-phosphate synthase